jgi:hypothetical protein
VAEGTTGPEEGADLWWGSYVVGDYLNLDLNIYHQMHIVEALVVFSHMDDEMLVMVMRGETELEEADSMSMRSVLQVSREITLEDVPGAYALTRVEVVTVSTRVLPLDYERRPAFEIVPEEDMWSVEMRLHQHTRGEPLYPIAEDYDDESVTPDPEQ